MGQLRIIAGKWKRRPIPVQDLKGLRPTPDRVRETLFNWLGQRLDGWRCLDLFAGSGALGLEAASRGADRVIFVESDALAAQAIAQRIDRVGGAPECQIMIPVAARLLAPTGLIYIESEAPLDANEMAAHGLSEFRADKAGAVHYHLLQFSASQGAQDANRSLSGHI